MIIGFRKVFKGIYTNHVEIVLQALNSLAMTTFFLYSDAENAIVTLKILQCIILFRCFKMGSFLRELKAVKVFEKTIALLFRSLFSLMMVLYTVYIIYSELGVLFFGGTMSYQEQIILNSLNSDIPLSYVYLNFNDLANGCITLFALMVNNNWQYIVYMYTLQAKSNVISVFVSLYFISYFIICVYVVLNILIAFIIDLYSAMDENERQKMEEMKKREREEMERYQQLKKQQQQEKIL